MRIKGSYKLRKRLFCSHGNKETPELFLNLFNLLVTAGWSDLAFAKIPVGVSSCLWKSANKNKPTPTKISPVPANQYISPEQPHLSRWCQPTYNPESPPVHKFHISQKPYLISSVCSVLRDHAGLAEFSLIKASNKFNFILLFQISSDSLIILWQFWHRNVFCIEINCM